MTTSARMFVAERYQEGAGEGTEFVVSPVTGGTGIGL
jgi:hypothetical protein